MKKYKIDFIYWYGSNVNFKKLAVCSTNASQKFHLKKRKNSLNFAKRSVYALSSMYIYVPVI
jgi:hypothetical protein